MINNDNMCDKLLNKASMRPNIKLLLVCKSLDFITAVNWNKY